MASVCKCFNWTPTYVMHGISYAALMLTIDGIPDSSGKRRNDHPDPKAALRAAGIDIKEI